MVGRGKHIQRRGSERQIRQIRQKHLHLGGGVRELRREKRSREGERKTGKTKRSAGSPLKWLQLPFLGQAETRSQEFSLNLP